MVDSFTWKGGGGKICFIFFFSFQRSLVRRGFGGGCGSENLKLGCCAEEGGGGGGERWLIFSRGGGGGGRSVFISFFRFKGAWLERVLARDCALKI